MHLSIPHPILLSTLLLALSTAVPLNINLGAYSPALVVGDGEISFGGGAQGDAARSAAEIMSTLETSAVNAAGTQQQGAAQQQQPAAGQQAPAAPAAPADPAAAVGAEGKEILSSTSTTTPTDASSTSTATSDPSASASASPSSSAEITKKVLQLHSKRDPTPSLPSSSSSSDDALNTLLQKRQSPDIQGFRESLNFAANAQKSTPEIQLGTEAAGVGILQRPGSSVPAGSPAAGGSGGGAAPAAGAEGRKRRDMDLQAREVVEALQGGLVGRGLGVEGKRVQEENGGTGGTGVGEETEGKERRGITIIAVAEI